jgi:uncharacterized protein
MGLKKRTTSENYSHRNPRAYLSEVVRTGRRTQRLLAGKTFDAYLRDSLAQSATERQVSIIGHALRRLAETHPDIAAQIAGHGPLADLGESLVRDYDKVDHEAVWKAVTVDMPTVVRQAASIQRKITSELPRTRPRAHPATAGANRLIAGLRPELETLCRKYGVKRLYIFGSAARDDFDPKRSDIDLVVKFAPPLPGEALKQYLGFREELEKLYGRKVDLVELGAVRNKYFRRELNATMVQLYAA